MVRIACVGAGWQGQGHLKTLSQIGGVALAGVCDLNPAAAAKAASKFSVQAYGSYEEMLEQARPDGVIICTPPEVRLELVRAAAMRGIHCFIEKPPARDLAEAYQVAEVLERTGVISSVGFMYRYSRAVDQARAVLGRHRAALVRSALLDGLALRPGWPRWFFNKERSGGPVFDQAIHMFDLCRYLLGEAAQVSGFQANLTVPKGGDFTVEDSFSLALQWQSGVLHNHTHSWAFPRYVARVEFYSDELELVLDLGRGRLTGTAGGQEVAFESADDALYRLELEAFVQAVGQGRPDLVRSTYRDSVRSLALTLSAVEAVETGRVIPIG